jgi:hypothetical protein
METLHKLKRENKPWAALGLSRRAYETSRPWKKARMQRDQFEEILLALPASLIEDIKDHAHAEALLEGIFGKDALQE